MKTRILAMRRSIIVTLAFACSCGSVPAPRPGLPPDAELPKKSSIPEKTPIE